MLVVANHLYALTDRSANQRTLQRLMMIDRRSGHRSDDRTPRLAVVMTMVSVVVIVRRCECAARRQKERQAQHRCLDLFGCHEVLPPGVGYCEFDAA
jgi:hypothetical protein